MPDSHGRQEAIHNRYTKTYEKLLTRIYNAQVYTHEYVFIHVQIYNIGTACIYMLLLSPSYRRCSQKENDSLADRKIWRKK